MNVVHRTPAHTDRRGKITDLLEAGDAPLPLLNVVAALVYAVALPFVALTTSYVYFDARTRFELEARDPDKLPAEIALRG